MPTPPLFRGALIASLAVLCSACQSPPPSRSTAQPSTPAITSVAPPVTVAERYVAAESPAEELDSLATWQAADGRVWLIATGKSSHRLLIHDADSGRPLRAFGSKGSAPGQFFRPNGIAVSGSHLFVVERDNHRVQVLALPELTPLGSFGSAQLKSPYGLWLHATEPGELDVYVTDSFMDGPDFDRVPPLAQLDQRVRHYRVRFDQDGRPIATDVGAFGDTSATAALRMVESIAGDPANDRLLIADEHPSAAHDRRGSTLREYTFSGHYTGHSLPPHSFSAEAEGVALWRCPDGGGYWIAVDQLLPLTVFHLFDRVTLEPRGSFSGRTTAHTDGIALHAAATARFPGGALFAVHDDKAVAAFDLRDVANALDLAPGCVQ